MSVQILSAVAVRVTGIVIGLYAVKTGASYLYTAQQSNQDPWLFVVLTPSVMMVSASVCMIAFPRVIAGNLLPVDDGTKKEPASIGELETLGCILLGLYFLIQAVLDAVWMMGLYFGSKALGYEWIWLQDSVATIAVAIAELAFAIWLLLGAKGLSGLLRWAKHVHAD